MKGKKTSRQSLNLKRLPWFYSAFKWLEGGTNPYAISDFEAKIKENVNSDNALSKLDLKTFLKQRYDKFIDSTQF